MSTSRDTFIGEMLVENGAISPVQLEDAQLALADKEGSLVDWLVSSKIIEFKRLWSTVADEMDLEFLEAIKGDDVETHLIADLPIVFAKSNNVLPLSETSRGVRVACGNPFDLGALDAVQAIIGRPVVPVIVPEEAILEAINTVYERSDASLDESAVKEEEELTDLIDAQDEAPIIRWVNQLFFEAVKRRASDIHVEPLERDVGVRYRVDGVLHNAKSVRKAFMPSIISRVKILANLNLAEKRLPQDGRIGLKIAGKSIDVNLPGAKNVIN